LWIAGALIWSSWQSLHPQPVAAKNPPAKSAAVVKAAAMAKPAVQPAPDPVVDRDAQHIAEADRILTEYRESSDPVLHHFDWHKAEIRLQDATDLGRADDEMLGKLALAKGYAVLEHLSVGDFTDNRVAQLRKEARADFEEAARRSPQGADPHLGLARIFVYSMPDLDRALAEFHQAETLGAKFGPREIEEQADAYRIRAQQLEPGAPREAWQAAQMARPLYRRLGDFDRAQQHLQELSLIHPPSRKSIHRRTRWP
jgi:tetratricopeptide (TPR) repeat protein